MPVLASCRAIPFFVATCLVLIPNVLPGQESEKETNYPVIVEPTEENLESWTKFILPEESDLVWRNVDWLTTFGDGVVAANKADKPLLLWVMNGHPFGCT